MQCCKEWKRIVKEKSFLCMYRHDGVFEIKNRFHFPSPVRHLIRKLKLNDPFIFQFYTNNHQEFTFSRIDSIECITNVDLDASSLFRSLAPKLLQLKVVSEVYSINTLVHFPNSLSILTSLTSLDISVYGRAKIENLSFLYHMKQLKIFLCDIYQTPAREIVRHLITLPNLRSVEFTTGLEKYQKLYYLKEICSESEKLKLTHFGWLQNIPDEQYVECLHLLNKLKYLETIDICVDINQIPILLGKWIHELYIRLRPFISQDVIDIISLPHLKSLTLSGCRIDDYQMIHLIHGLSPILEDLKIIVFGESSNNCELRISSLSHCMKLKTLELKNILIIDLPDFHLLSNCQHLECIKLTKMNISQDLLSEKIQKALSIPSAVFPMLKISEFSNFV
jgi:hypothetical protein